MNKSFQIGSLLIAGLVLLGASAVHSATLNVSHAIVAGSTPVGTYMHDVAQAMRRTETGALSLQDR